MKKLHRWDLSYSQARELQTRLAQKVNFMPLKKTPRLIAGLDCAFSKDGKRILAAVVVLSLPGFELVETVSAIRDVNFPYIPGLLSFREAPVCIVAVEKLRTRPDVFMIDGQGIAHPRRLGLAAHLGLFFDKPTIGCAKSRLIGSYQELRSEKGAYSPLKDEKANNDEIIGAVVRTRTNVKPVFVSVGHKCLLDDAIKITLMCAGKYRLPEPTRLAHQQVSQLKLEL
ncbi:MAG: deoxyribonuclease V [Sedimentisphaerales bacterium]|nr:deoxyribonuclease V [Sedimentisphaerales bacterium]